MRDGVRTIKRNNFRSKKKPLINPDLVKVADAMAQTIKACEMNNYWIKMPEMITTFAVAVSYTQKDLEHYLDQED